ncbi:MAG TPA: hypothetical protein P5256_00945 [Beijerinckiaceae bacterium]|nr:hypothetical protein [Rhodoblastus sp.]MCB1533369.1 hypothetical protein [Rhodoblastus sp.]MCC2106090.1 hypothetical protein [Hyphomicrobiales bacterium]HPG04243.1 hypothetical protein [Rhodoblastus sp.]HRY01661.1 hypothetical protein [Beijerinckiaceae bacterium]
MTDYDAAGLARLLGRGRQCQIHGRATPTFKTFCPAHDDKNNPSLLVADGYKTVVFHCYAACSQTQVIDALKNKYDATPKRFDVSSDASRLSSKSSAAASASSARHEPEAPRMTWAGCGLPHPPQAWQIRPPPGRWKEAGRWAWRSASGEILMWNIRFDSLDDPTEKTFIPMSVWEENGKKSWEQKAVATPRILYDLHLQDIAPDILMLEGEKSVETAKKWFGRGFWCTTTGAWSSVLRSDLSPLLGRRVVVATDMDGPGLAYASSIADYSPATSVEVLRIPSAFSPQLGDDLCNLDERGVTPAQFIATVLDSQSHALVKLR